MYGLVRTSGLQQLNIHNDKRYSKEKQLQKTYSTPDMMRAFTKPIMHGKQVNMGCVDAMDFKLASRNISISSPDLGQTSRENSLQYQFDADGDVCAVYEKRHSQSPLTSRMDVNSSGNTDCVGNDENNYNTRTMFPAHRVYSKSGGTLYEEDDNFSQIETVRVSETVRGTCQVCTRMNQDVSVDDDGRLRRCRLCQAYGSDNRTMCARENPAFMVDPVEEIEAPLTSRTPNWNLMQQCVKFSLETPGRPGHLQREILSRNNSALPLHKRNEWKTIKKLCIAIIILISMAILAGLVITFTVILD